MTKSNSTKPGKKGQAVAQVRLSNTKPAGKTVPRSPPAEKEVSPARSRIMRSIRQKDTKPEILVRKLIHAMGFRFRLHQRGLPGKPDIVMRRHHVIIQVHGCFWHQHGCSISNIPRTRKEYWIPKLARNAERDEANLIRLTSMGWRVITVWECELRDLVALSRKLHKFVGSKPDPRKISVRS
jgi:DNA mismatch endonuclease (patch repair protein)